MANKPVGIPALIGPIVQGQDIDQYKDHSEWSAGCMWAHLRVA